MTIIEMNEKDNINNYCELYKLFIINKKIRNILN